MKKNIIIFKNDAVGDLVQSLDAINNIIKHNLKNNILIYLSERSKNFDFLFNHKNVKIKILNYDLSLFEKTKIIYSLIKNKIEIVYVLTPKKFYFYLPVLFQKIKFYAVCINSVNNYKRPSNFLRKYLYKYVINERDRHTKRESTMKIQKNLTLDLNYDQKFKINFLPTFKYEDLSSMKDYIYFHLKISNFKKLGWDKKELKIIFQEFLKYKKNVIFTRDIENSNENFINDFNVINFSNNERIKNNSNIYLYDYIKGSDLYHVIRNADKVVAFHGMMTNLASIENRPVLDLFYCDIKSIDDFRKYKNALYEFKPSYDKYDFIVPSRDINKTINKMKFSLKKIYG